MGRSTFQRKTQRQSTVTRIQSTVTRRQSKVIRTGDSKGEYLYCGYKDKEQCKALGGLWNGKNWFVMKEKVNPLHYNVLKFLFGKPPDVIELDDLPKHLQNRARNLGAYWDKDKKLVVNKADPLHNLLYIASLYNETQNPERYNSLRNLVYSYKHRKNLQRVKLSLKPKRTNTSRYRFEFGPEDDEGETFEDRWMNLVDWFNDIKPHYEDGNYWLKREGCKLRLKVPPTEINEAKNLGAEYHEYYQYNMFIDFGKLDQEKMMVTSRNWKHVIAQQQI